MEQKTQSKNPYLRLGLIKNPFPSIPISLPFRDSPFCKEVFKTKIQYLEEFAFKVKNLSPQICLIVGERGCGKSAILKFLLKECQKLESTVSIYMTFGLTSGFAPLYRSALWWLGKDFIRNVCVSKASSHILPKYFLDFKLNPDKAYSRLIFIGDNIKFPILVELLNLIAEDKNIIIGIDSFDNIFSLLANNQKIDLIYGFNRLVFGIDGNVALFINARGNMLNWLKENRLELKYLGIDNRLIEPSSIFINKLQLDQAYTLVSYYIKTNRLLSFIDKDEMFPFTHDAIELIYYKSRGNIRNFLLLCHDILNYSLYKSSSIINVDTVSKYLVHVR